MDRRQTPYSDYECSGPNELVVGAARGKRTFHLGDDGVLRGLTYKQAWRDGENVATCLVAKPGNLVPFWAPPPPGFKWSTSGYGFALDPEVPPTLLDNWKADPCKGLEPGCACGFYAYHNRAGSYAFGGSTDSGLSVFAVIEGYGKVILGPKGYRCEKARIVAVALPKVNLVVNEQRAQIEVAIREIEDEIADHEKHVRRPCERAMTYALSTVGFLGFAMVPSPARWLSLVAAGAMAAATFISQRYYRNLLRDLIRQGTAELVKYRQALENMPKDYEPIFAQARLNYPGVTFYDDSEEMLHDYPVNDLGYLVKPPDPDEGKGDQ